MPPPKCDSTLLVYKDRVWLAAKRHVKAMARGRNTRNSRRGQSSVTDNGVSQVHREMVREVADLSQVDERPLKKRKLVVDRHTVDRPVHVTPAAGESDATAGESTSEDVQLDQPQEQIVYDDSASSSSEEGESGDEFEYDWKNILSKEESQPGHDHQSKAEQDISINLGDGPPATPRRSAPRRLPGSAAEKRWRVAVHKAHLITLLFHVYARSCWCNDEGLHAQLRPLLNERVIEFLTPDSSLSQFDQTSRLIKGLDEAGHVWRGHFTTHGVGMRSSTWATSPEALESRRDLANTTEPPLDRAAFFKAARKRAGSRDVGAQLFCAMLRSAGVDARLVCSLQPLPFTSGPVVTTTSTPQKPTIDLSSSAQKPGVSFYAFEGDSEGEASSMPKPIKRFGGHGTRSNQPVDLGKAPTVSSPKPRRTRDSPFPIFWVEVFNHSRQKWIPVDALVTQTVSKPAKFEPPASDSLNNMTYVIAVEEDGTAHDVTRRYAKAYNAKTRKHRVEIVDGGRRWLRKTMKLFKGPPLDRDAIEEAELLKAESDEPMPKNVQDFKDHPHYALERHLRRNEVISPRREVGKLSVGKAAEAVEPIFRRRDVLQLRTADKWFRVGRELQPGAQPLKRVPRPRRFRRSPSADSDGDEESMGLYAASQTDPYVPPPVIKGRIPKNQFKNLDIYVPSMIPPGAVHIRASDGVLAARTLAIDFAEAVTGFRFKGRQGTAVTQGVIVASEYREAMEEVVEGLRYQHERAEAAKRTAEALKTWKRLWTGLKIRQRIIDEHGEAEPDEDMQDAIDDEEYREEKARAEGGFMLDKDQTAAAEPTAGHAPRSNYDSLSAMDRLSLRDPTVPRNYFFEPTVVSPWDRPGALGGPVPEDKGRAPDLDDLFGDDNEGGLVREQASSSGEVAAAGDGAVAGRPSPNTVHEGGGFVPESNPGGGDSEGGGFVPEEDVELPPADSSRPAGEAHDLAEDAEAMDVDSPVESARDGPGQGVEDTGASKDDKPQEAAQSDSSDLEASSLPSHDPDEDDAEPDWLYNLTTL